MAVYTEVSDEELEAFVAQYDIGAVAERITKASIKLSPDVITFLKGYVDKVTSKKTN